ncbi:MAG: hypothetical protein KKA05_00705 [Alphaproteobacteria bacterium]|nr:hypothetical protein [Alphaproteobacteria bacterium]MBU0859031.1 hypothetical protein [Alphaproteobacteria bacterium]
MKSTARQKILWGVCGIGHGHIFRQLPLVEHFAKSSDIVIFGYGESYDFYKKHFANQPQVTVERVAVPFYVGSKDGLDFEATAQRPENKQDYAVINGMAMAQAEKRLGRPDLVVSDYEPISAQYAYAHNAPLVTLDQQSKYLCGDFPAPLKGQTFIDEVMRLRLFFPKADQRLACSFFQVAKRPDAAEDVEICAPVLGDKIKSLQRHPEKDGKSILIYVSSQQAFGQSYEEISTLCAHFPDVRFSLFGKNIPPQSASNLKIYEHGSSNFHEVLASCNGIISTAGHTLLSEAMYLGIPVYAIPLPLYEQEMNAHVIHENGFGLSCARLDADTLSRFIRDIPLYEDAIRADKKILLREAGQEKIIDSLQRQMHMVP